MDASEITQLLAYHDPEFAYHDPEWTDWSRYLKVARFYADKVTLDACGYGVRIRNERDGLFSMWMDGQRDEDGTWTWGFNKYIFFDGNPSDQWDKIFQELILKDDNIYRYEEIECICDNAIAEYPDGTETVHVTA